MGRIKSRSRTLLASATVAFVLISRTVVALPSQERKPDELLLEPVDLPPEITTKAPLMRRAGGESGAAHARYLRQVEAAAVFEASRLVARTERERVARGDLYEGPDGSVFDWTKSQSSNSKDPTAGGIGNRQFQSLMNDFDDPNTVGELEAFGTLVGAAGERHPYPRDHHHSHYPDDHSRGGHSEHWFDHHGLKPSSHHRNHHNGHHNHHTRQKGNSPSRLVRVRGPAIDDDEPATLIAPRSARLIEDNLLDARGGAGTFSAEILKIERTGEETDDFDEEDNLDSLDRRGEAHEDKFNKRRASTRSGQPMDGIPGIIDLVQGSPNGEKLGGLSVSSLPANGTSPIVAPSVMTLIIDSTPNLIDQTTFFLHTFKDQSTLDHETPSTGTSRDLLVALEVPHIPDNSTPQQMCATFNPLELDVQVFGLALCMDQDSATNNRRMSQAFRYSPDTGVLTAFYGAEGARQSVLAAVNERIQVMDSNDDGHLSGASGWNGTGIYDLDPKASTFSPDWANHAISDFGFDSATPLEGGNSTYMPYSGLDSLSTSYPSGNVMETAWSSKTMGAAASTPTPLLSVNDTSMADHPFVVGAPTGEFVTTMGEGTSLSVIMVFRSNMESSSWRRTEQDVDTPEERQKALESYRNIGLASKNATGLDHWAVIDSIQSKSSTQPSSATTISAPSGKTTGQVVSNGAGAEKVAAPVGFWSDSEVFRSDGAEPTASDVRSDEDEPNEADDSLPPKPVLNVAYFGDSGRSAPVPPDEQADFAHPILVADPLAKPHMASKLATIHPQDLHGPEQDVPSVHRPFALHHGQEGQSSTPGVMATVSKSRTGPLGIPIDASD